MSPARSGPTSRATSTTRAPPASASPCSTATSPTITRAELAHAAHAEPILRNLEFERDGARRYDAAAASVLPELLAFADALPGSRAGVRISRSPAMRPLLQPSGAIGGIAASILGDGCRAVRAILFDKSKARNWSLGWHQDRTICVRERREMAGFGPWTVKQGAYHVEPPFDLLDRMVTARVHLDDVPADNGPLLIAPGSHRSGRVCEDSIEAAVRRCGIAACTATAGDIWLYATPILHASKPSLRPSRRRVLQIDYSADELPGGLEWATV